MPENTGGSGGPSFPKKEKYMKYYITYCITHPQHTPTTATGMVEARTRQDLEVRLDRGVEAWKKRGYTVEIMKVVCTDTIQNAVPE